MLASDPLYISPEDYLEAEKTSPIRHEYRDGEVFAMTGGTQNHNLIILNLAGSLKQNLKGSGCRTFAEGMKVHVERKNSYYYPDLVVSCDLRDRRPQSHYVEHLRLIIEVLSPSTARFDRTEKFADYRTIPTLTEYVIVSTESPQVQVFQRGDDDQWILSPNADPVYLASAKCEIAIADIYEDTDLL